MSAGTHKPAEALHQQIDEPKSEALRIADALDDYYTYVTLDMMRQAAAELRRQNARIAELEAQLEAISAGGVELLRKQAAAPQAVQAAVPVAWRLTNTAFRKPRFEYHDTKESAEQRQADFNRSVDDGGLHNLTPLYAAPAHPAEGVPAQASEWDGKLPERLQSVLNALRLELPAAVVNDVEFEVRSHYEAMHTSLSTSRRMYGAARDRLEAIDAAQPDPFAATQPAAHGVDVVQAAKALCKHAAKVQNVNFDDYWLIHAEEFKEEAQIVLDAAQAKQWGVA